MKTFLTTLRNTGLRYRSFMLFYVIASAIASVGLVLMNRFSGEMSEAAVNEDINALVRLLLLITGIMIVRAIAAAASTIYLAHFSAAAGYKLREHFINYFLRVPFAQVEKAGSGESLSIYSNDIPRAENFISTGILEMIADFISFVSAFMLLIIISPSFTGILLLAAIGMLLFQFLLSRPIQKWSVKLSEESAQFNAVVNDSLQNISVVAAYSLEDVLEKRYLDAYNKFFSIMKRFSRALAFMVGMMMSLLLSPLIVVFIVLALAVIGGDMSLAEFIAFVTTIIIAAGGIMSLAQNIGRLAESAAGAKRLNENTAHPLEVLETEKPYIIKSAAISFSNVTFAYNEDAQPALDDVSFDITPGSKIAIVGGSGSGKSTILKLLLGLYEPNSGEITINQQSTVQLSKSCLRDIFAYLPQDSFLFPGSIGENIVLEPHISNLSRLENACTDAGILDFINTLPDGFSGRLSEAADNISGGQRQRIAMARAFYKNAPVILFDEATSSLDPATEAGILASLNNAAADKTIIMVAHRATAISACDSIIVMHEGKISGIGKHDELLKNNEDYKRLYQNRNNNESEVA